MKLPDASIISSIQAVGKTLQVTLDDLICFEGAGASENVIVALSNVMASAPASVHAARNAVAPVQASVENRGFGVTPELARSSTRRQMSL